MDFRPPTGDEQRTFLAGERTLLAWVRTSLALMGFGFLVAKFGLFLREVVSLRASSQTPIEPPAELPGTGLSLWLGVAMVLLGLMVNLLAARDHLHFMRQFAGTELGRRQRYVAEIAMLFVLTVIGAVLCWYLIRFGD